MARRRTERIVYHVAPDSSAERWIVSQEQGDFRREFDKKFDAVEFAKQKARQEKLCQVKVLTRGGNMEYESTYGKDPRNILDD